MNEGLSMKRVIQSILMGFGIFFIVLILFFALFGPSIISALVIGGAFTPKLTFEDATQELADHREDLSTLTAYLAGSIYKESYLTIDCDSPEILHLTSGQEIPILEDTVRHAVDQLRWYGYQIVNRDGSVITFQIWSNLRKGRGLAYSLDGNTPHSDYITDCQLIEGNWYYYEDEDN